MIKKDFVVKVGVKIEGKQTFYLTLSLVEILLAKQKKRLKVQKNQILTT